MSYTETGRKYHIDPRTAKKYAEADSRPEYVLTEPKDSKLDPYKKQINIWLEEAPYSATRIFGKIKERGFSAGYSIVKQYVRGKKEQLNEKATVRFETTPGLQGQVDWTLFEDYRGSRIYHGQNQYTPSTKRLPHQLCRQSVFCTSKGGISEKWHKMLEIVDMYLT